MIACFRVPRARVTCASPTIRVRFARRPFRPARRLRSGSRPGASAAPRSSRSVRALPPSPRVAAARARARTTTRAPRADLRGRAVRSACPPTAFRLFRSTAEPTLLSSSTPPTAVRRTTLPPTPRPTAVPRRRTGCLQTVEAAGGFLGASSQREDRAKAERDRAQRNLGNAFAVCTLASSPPPPRSRSRESE